ncbi:MAG TPA: YerC/YecD family TrpR-related protein [Gemmatimonadaceae bacterium]|jgi:TrpR family trp operon transcriptional repressor|nr:YerC/YecD family TrpR-related protein [Gemmatimonadaceae bacterium]
MPSKQTPPKLPQDLLSTLARLTNVEEISRLLSDLLTPGEIEAVTERWDILRLLTAGKSQRDISAELGVSITTVSRGSRQLKYGPGGFQHAFDGPHRT